MEIVSEVIHAIERRDWSSLRLLLHPYVHWTGTDGSTIRGRINVITRLERTGPVGPPARHQLRDGQIYRWVEKRDSSDSAGE